MTNDDYSHPHTTHPEDISEDRDPVHSIPHPADLQPDPPAGTPDDAA